MQGESACPNTTRECFAFPGRRKATYVARSVRAVSRQNRMVVAIGIQR
jgi:hypothetical protein